MDGKYAWPLWRALMDVFGGWPLRMALIDDFSGWPLWMALMEKVSMHNPYRFGG